MADQLKEMFNVAFYKHLASEFEKVYPPFNASKFVKGITENLKDLSLNQRLRNTSLYLKKYLPKDYTKSIEFMFQVIPAMKSGYTTLVFPDYVGLFGQNDFDLSMKALKYFTSFGSSEFAIREFLKRDFDKTLGVMLTWSEDVNPHVRRLSSEGSRPRLPWSFKLDEVIRHPQKTLPILQNLKDDEELYVKKSVANHLNDISKDNPDWMMAELKKWDEGNMHTQWIKKHASRTLIKKGNANALALFNFEKDIKVKIENFKLNKTKLVLGDNLLFEFDLVSEKSKPQKLVVDYTIHYVKKSKELSPKVFKLKEVNLHAKQTLHVKKQHLFRDFSTRKHFSGRHMLDIMVNGIVVYTQSFELITK